MAVAVVDIAKLAPGQRVALDVVNAALLDLPFVLGCPRATRRNEEPIVFGELPVAPLHLGVVESSADNRGAEIVQHDAAGHAAEELERCAMQAQPARDA